MFCRPTALQSTIYHKLLLNSVNFSSNLLPDVPGSVSYHLLVINSLRKVCDHPCLLLPDAQRLSHNVILGLDASKICDGVSLIIFDLDFSTVLIYSKEM